MYGCTSGCLCVCVCLCARTWIDNDRDNWIIKINLFTTAKRLHASTKSLFSCLLDRFYKHAIVDTYVRSLRSNLKKKKVRYDP